jgi:hypothetical protein
MLDGGTAGVRERYADMPRFYFHLHNDVDAKDEEGKEFADLAAARDAAMMHARQLAGETAKETGRIVLSHRIDIEDEEETVLDTVHFGDVLKVEP